MRSTTSGASRHTKQARSCEEKAASKNERRPPRNLIERRGGMCVVLHEAKPEKCPAVVASGHERRFRKHATFSHQGAMGSASKLPGLLCMHAERAKFISGT